MVSDRYQLSVHTHVPRNTIYLVYIIGVFVCVQWICLDTLYKYNVQKYTYVLLEDSRNSCMVLNKMFEIGNMTPTETRIINCQMDPNTTRIIENVF